MNNTDRSPEVTSSIPSEEGRYAFELIRDKGMTLEQVVEHLEGMNKELGGHYISTSLEKLCKVLESELRGIDNFIEKMETSEEKRGEKREDWDGDKTRQDRSDLSGIVEQCWQVREAQ